MFLYFLFENVICYMIKYLLYVKYSFHITTFAEAELLERLKNDENSPAAAQLAHVEAQARRVEAQARRVGDERTIRKNDN